MTLPSVAAAGECIVERGSLRIEIGLAPLRIHVRRARRRLLRALTVWACEGEVPDPYVQVTGGAIAGRAPLRCRPGAGPPMTSYLRRPVSAR